MPRPDLLPRCCSTLKVPERLCQLERLHHNALLLLVVSDLRVPGQWEILPQWMSIKPVIRHDTPQIWVTCEEDTEQVVYFTLVPVGAIVEVADRGHGCRFVGVSLDADARVVAD